MERYEVLTGVYFDGNGAFCVQWDKPSAVFGTFDRRRDAEAVAEWLDDLFLFFCEEWNGVDERLTSAQEDQRPSVRKRLV